MPILEILELPDPRLREVAVPVPDVNDEVRQRVDDMLETMYDAPGIGLAASQVNDHRRIVVMDISEGRDQPRCFINPEIIAEHGHQTYEEGCLSVPGIYAKVERANEIRVRALDRDGKPFELDADGLLAVCIQHELDHLAGILFVDHLSALKRRRVLKKLEKQRKVPETS